MTIFFEKTKKTCFAPQLLQAKVRYYPHFFSQKDMNNLFEKLLKETPWQQDKITLYGKTYLQPRLTALYSKYSKPYTYSGITMHPKKMPISINKIMKAIEKVAHTDFNSVLLNLYRNERDSNGWHADDENELGPFPVIASLSLGQERFFYLKHKKEKSEKLKIKLANGSILIMEGETQKYWQHQIPKTKTICKERINLTFRKIV